MLHTPFQRVLAMLCSLSFILCGTRAALAFKMTSPANYSTDNVNCPASSVPGPSVTIAATGGLTQPEIVPIFWGPEWATNNGATSATTSRGEVIAYLQALANGAYFAALSQYGSNGGIAPVRISAQAPTDTSLVNGGQGMTQPQSNILDPAEISKMLLAGEVPPPSQYSDVVFDNHNGADHQTNSRNGGILSWGDYNLPHTCQNNECGSGLDNVNYMYAVAVGSDFAGLSHEIVEAITNNVIVTNCTYSAGALAGGPAKQIGDVCGGNTGSVPTLFNQTEFWSVTASYWSAIDNACVVPAGWPDMWEYRRSAQSWTKIWSWGPIQQAYVSGGSAAGYPDLVVQSNGFGPNELYQYAGSADSWFLVDGMRAAWSMDGHDNITALSGDGSAIYIGYYGNNDGIFGMTNVGLPSAYASGIVGANQAVSTDGNGVPYFWNRTPNCSGASCWTSFGPKGDQFVGFGGDVAAISADHKNVWLGNPSTNPQWNFNERGPTWRLFGNPGTDTLLATDLGPAANVWAMSWYQGPNLWAEQGGAANDFAVAGRGALMTIWGLDRGRNDLYQDDTLPLIADPNWVSINGWTGRLVGGGLLSTNEVVLYATSCANAPGTCVVY